MSSFKIPASLKSEFKKGMDEYIKVMGEKIEVQLSPYTVDCPNCIFDIIQQKSSNIYDTSFLKPVNIFPGTSHQRKIYPAPFNVLSDTGVQYDPSIPNPKILQTALCPTCKGEGILTEDNSVCITGVVTRGINRAAAESSDLKDLSAGREGITLIRIKTYGCNYALCKDAKYFIIAGIKYKLEVPTRLKGLGNKAIVEMYLSEIDEGTSIDTGYNLDPRVQINTKGQVSDQADISMPTIPPVIPGDDVW